METIKESLNKYTKDRIPPGGFLKAVLENDLMGAIGSADHINRQRLHEICKYVYNELPSGIWGSKDIVKSHLQGSFNLI